MEVRPLLTDLELLSGIAKADQRAFRIVYDRFYVRIYSYALHLLKSDLLAEENVQETFLVLWNRGDKLTEIKNIESFLITISKNRSLNVLKRSKLEVRAGRESVEDLSINLGHNETEERILLNETQKIIDEAIAALPPQQKLVYQLCHQEGMKYEEAAEQLNLSINTVKLYMKLALSSLRSYVSKHTDIAALLILFKLL
jgi:RNA polymerase sigma-70 factor (family 1)